nr:DNA-directed RNA polymerase subunit beta [Neobacillus sp. Marseille-Q6967]
MAVNHQQVRSRDEYKKGRETEKKTVAERPAAVTSKRIRIRLIPIWLRIVLLAVSIVVCATAGAMVGYGFLGDGKAMDVLKQSTWTHIIDLVEKK